MHLTISTMRCSGLLACHCGASGTQKLHHSLSGHDAGDAPFPHPVLRIYFLVVLRLLSFDLLRSNGLARANRQSIYVLKHAEVTVQAFSFLS